jgi:hypothetical protein
MPSFTLEAVVRRRRYLTSQNIWRALVAMLRSNTALRTAVLGGIHEGRAPEKVAYPHLVWTPVVPGVNEDDWSSRMIVALGDVVIVSRSSVEASNLDQSVADLLDEGVLTVIGQTALICYRTADIRLDEPDEEGQKVYRIGGSYEIWTNQ